MKTNLKVTEDFISYIKHIDKVSATLKPQQRKQLENILETLLIILVTIKKGSNLGKVTFDWDNSSEK